MYITYYASDDTMGETPPEQCERYRAWARAALQLEYPDHQVAVVSEPSLVTCATDDEDRREEICDFAARLWDQCPWDWEQFFQQALTTARKNLPYATSPSQAAQDALEEAHSALSQATFFGCLDALGGHRAVLARLVAMLEQHPTPGAGARPPGRHT